MNHARGRDRREARSLGRGARALIGIALTVLLLALQTQFVAGAASNGEDPAGPAAETSEASVSDASASLPTDQPPPSEEPAAEAEAPAAEAAPADEAPAEEAPAEEAPADEEPPAPDPAEGSTDGGSGDGDTAPAPGGSTESEDTAVDGSGSTSDDDDSESRLRRVNRFRAERALAQPPEPDPDNPMCSDFGLLELTRFDPVPGSGSVTQNGVTITITDSNDEGEATEFSWSSETPVDLVIVKAGPGASLYPYDEETRDSGLTGPERKGISHISFCYDVEEDEPDVKIEKSANLEADPSAGDTFSYTITVTNVGTGTAEGVQVTDTFPDGLSVDGQRLPQGCSLDGNTVTCNLGDIEEGDSVSLTIWVTVEEGFCGELANTAHVTADNDVNPDNNTSNTVTLNVKCEPDVSVSKSADFEGEVLLPGGTLTYTITVTSGGTGTAEGVTLTDDLNDELEDVVATPSQGECSVGTGNALSCALGDIDQGDSVTVTITATVPQDFCGELTNQATVDAENDTNSENNQSDTVRVTVECQPDVQVEKSAVIEGNPRPGDTFDFSITVTNVGTGTAEDVVLTDLIQDGLAIEGTDPGPPTCTIQAGEGGETVTCALGDIPQGESVTVTITVTVDEDFCGPIENTAEITSPSDSNPENDSDTITFEAVCQPDVSVSKSAEVDGDPVDEVPSGSSFTYVITVTNEGTGTAEGVTLSDDLDDSLQNVTATPSQGTCLVGSLNTLSCQLGDIAQGATVTVTIDVDVPADFCGELRNQATVDAENDTNEQNNQSDLIRVDVPCGPDIDVRKTNDADTDGSFSDEEEALHEGDPVTFKVVITNTGNVAIELDSLLDEYEGTSINPDCLTAEGESVLGMTLQPGESVTCFFTVEDYAPEPNGRIIDVVTVEGHNVENPEETVSDSDDSAVTTPEVLPVPPVRPEPPTPAPPILPVTGAELALMGLVALALVLAGIALSYLGRREDESGT